MKTTLRYLLIVVAILSVLGVSAQTPQYGKSYNPQHSFARAANTPVDAQMPAATMGSIDAGYVLSGSSLPMAAQSGVTTTYDNPRYAPSRPRRNEDDGWEDDPDPDNPGEPNPIGDVMWPMMMLALAYAGLRAFLNRKRALKG